MSREWPKTEDVGMWMQRRDALRAKLARVGHQFDTMYWSQPLMCTFIIMPSPQPHMEVQIWPVPCIWGGINEYYWGCFVKKDNEVIYRHYPLHDSNNTDAVSCDLETLMRELEFVYSPNFQNEVRIDVT